MSQSATNYQIASAPLAAGQDLTQICRHFAAEPWCQLLDSAAPGHPHHRWQILVRQPSAWLQSTNGQHQLWRDGQLQSLSGDLLPLLASLQPATPQPPHPLLPFVGGLIGLWGYDLARQFEHLPSQHEADLPLPDLAMAYYPQALLLDLAQQQLYTVAPTAAKAEQGLNEALALLKQPAPPAQPFKLTSHWQSNLSRSQYLERFAQVQQHLQAGDCYQINLAQRFSARYQGDEWQAYLRLRQANGAPFGAYLRLDSGSVLCFSPERFLHIEQGTITTRPIKGTRPRVQDPAQEQEVMAELAASTKERAENVMIVDLLRNDLGKVAAPGSVQVPELFAVERYPYVYHLVSTVSAKLAAGKGALDALRACFPGGSITGAPKLRAMSIIDALEPHRRNLYCGSILYLSNCGRMDSNIVIRTALCCDSQIHVAGGGGLVVDSNGAWEYQETLDKLARILPLLSDS